MRRIGFVILIVCSVWCRAYAKEPLGRVSVILSDSTVITGFCENMFKHQRPTVKVSPRPDGKNAVKYQAADILELRYEIPNDTVAEYWYPVPYYHTKTLMMKKERQCGTVTLWTACIGLQEQAGPQGMRWTERVRDCVSFGPDMADGTAWDIPHVIHGRCKQLPGYGDFVKGYMESHKEVKDWTEIESLMEMCAAYVDSVRKR